MNQSVRSPLNIPPVSTDAESPSQITAPGAGPNRHYSGGKNYVGFEWACSWGYHDEYAFSTSVKSETFKTAHAISRVI